MCVRSDREKTYDSIRTFYYQQISAAQYEDKYEGKATSWVIGVFLLPLFQSNFVCKFTQKVRSTILMNIPMNKLEVT